ncbi:MAG: ORF6N domain-containing protein [Chitinophagaceae bacterium]|nr:ORF6N domain-containing protein [Chitinophagaceae bacterium]
MVAIESIQNRIYTIREKQVMLDFDLAALYEVETKVLNQAVKRNANRFPEDFMFRLTAEEWEELRDQIPTGRDGHVDMRSQIVTASAGKETTTSVVFSINTIKKRADKFLPHAFTEQGVGMLSGVLHSDKAVKMHLAIIRTFVAVKRLNMQQLDLLQQIKFIKEKLGVHDDQLEALYDAMDNLVDESSAKRKWDNRTRIGFKP